RNCNGVAIERCGRRWRWVEKVWYAIDLCKVRRTDGKIAKRLGVHAARIGEGKERSRRFQCAHRISARTGYFMHLLARKVIECVDAGDDGSERGGNLWIAYIGPVLQAVHDVFVDFGM